MSDIGKGNGSVSVSLGWIPQSKRWVPSLRYLLRRNRVLSLLPHAQAGAPLLEIGCGAGALLIELQDLGYCCTGLETSEAAIALARQLVRESERDIELVAAPQKDWAECFEMIMAFDVLEHIEDDNAELRQWWDWLAPQGRMMLSVPAHASRWGAGDVWAGHFRRYERDSLVRKLKDCGFQIEAVECYGFPLANATEFLGDRYYRRELDRRDATDGWRDQATRNALSGIDRKAYRRILPLMTTIAGRLMLQAGFILQRKTIRTDWGSGYLVMARKQ